MPLRASSLFYSQRDLIPSGKRRSSTLGALAARDGSFVSFILVDVLEFETRVADYRYFSETGIADSTSRLLTG
ncbi:MAG: hypothetical protein LBC27_04595 [Spirochaetaceae bacterium]|nr:hypothetical protein [Spirochaetaceae bacterium]